MRRRQLGELAAVGLLGAACGEHTPIAASGLFALEDVVVWILETERDAVVARAHAEIEAGLPLATLLGASVVAGYRALPLLPVGFLLHPVFTAYPAWLVSRALPVRDEPLPLLWLLWMLRTEIEAMSDEDEALRLGALDEARVPGPAEAVAAFRAAMEAHDADAAEVAAVGMLRAHAPALVREELWPWICRDLVPIGHQAITGAQVVRALDLVGWEHAQDPLRGLVRGLFESDAGSETLDDFAKNQARLADVRADWEGGKDDAAAMRDVAAAASEGTSDEAVAAVLDALASGVGPRSLSDGLLIAAGDLMLAHRDTNGVFPGLHAVTNANAFRVIARSSGLPQTRLLTLLQQAAFLPRDRAEAEQRTGGDKGHPERLLTLERAPGGASLDDVFAALGDRVDAAQKALAYADDGGDVDALAARHRAVLLVKAEEEHDYKYPVAAIEELAHVTPDARRHLVAISVLYGTTEADPDGAAYTAAIAAREGAG